MFKFLKNKKIRFFLINFFLLSSFFYAAQTAQAGLVPCGLTSSYTDRCKLCHLFVGIDNIIDWGMSILVVVALVAIVAGGIMYIISAGNSGMMESAKNVIKQALWGVVIVLGAWLIVNTVMFLIATKADLGIGVSSWSDFNCDGGTSSGGGGGGGGGAGGGGGGTGTNTCTSFNYSAWAPATCVAGSTRTRTATGVPAGCTGGTPGATSRACPTGGAGGTIPAACQPYDAAFDTASGGDANLKCLLVGIAMSESSCNPSVTNGSGCGLMQIENGDCDYLINHPEESITQAAQILNTNRAVLLNNYAATFDIGSSNTASGEVITYGGNTYDTGNDDLIASYNGGTGSGINPDGTKQPFALSTDCPVPPTPAWQCHLNAGTFGTATQPYVQNVQNVQNQCLGN